MVVSRNEKINIQKIFFWGPSGPPENGLRTANKPAPAISSPPALCYHAAVDPKPLIIGVAGGTGSGKTTIAKAIIEAVGPSRIALIPHDAYYKDAGGLPLAERAKVNFDHPDALETGLLVRHLEELIAGRPVEMPAYDFGTHTRLSKGRLVKPAPVIVLEGILIFCDEALRGLMDLKIYVDTASDLRFIRRLRRDVQERGRSLDSVVAQYTDTVRPMHLAFVEPSRQFADIIIPEGYKPVSTALVVTLIRQRLLEGGAGGP
jgi:uridine kinase